MPPTHPPCRVQGDFSGRKTDRISCGQEKLPPPKPRLLRPQLTGIIEIPLAVCRGDFSGVWRTKMNHV